MSRFNLSAFAVRNRAITLFLILATLAAGAIAFSKLGRAEDPSFTVKTMTITAAWPGATAREMQEQVASAFPAVEDETALYPVTKGATALKPDTVMYARATVTRAEVSMRTREADRRAEARIRGYEGEACRECGNFTLVRNGTCLKCDTCGGTSGCS